MHSAHFSVIYAKCKVSDHYHDQIISVCGLASSQKIIEKNIKKLPTKNKVEITTMTVVMMKII